VNATGHTVLENNAIQTPGS